MNRVRHHRRGKLRAAVHRLPAPVLFCALVLAALAPSAALAQAPGLKPQGYINDFAGVLSPAARERLAALATELDQKTKAQLAVVTVQSLNGQPIEDYSIALAEKWGIGSKKAGDTGVMLLLAVRDHQDRIEVGYGIEPVLTDGMAGDILRSMVPDLRRGDYDAAVTLGAVEIASIIAKAKHVELTGMPQLPRRQPRGQGGSPLGALIWVLILFGLPLLMFPRRYRGGWYGSSMSGFILGGILGSMLGGGMRGGGGGIGGGGFSSGGFGGFGGGGFRLLVIEKGSAPRRAAGPMIAGQTKNAFLSE
jgi:uncharacterized protein